MKLGIIGSGAWGTALAATSIRAGSEAILWALEPEVVEEINQQHQNSRYLKGVALDASITATSDLLTVAQSDAIFIVTPAQHLRSTCQKISSVITPATPVVICAKGIEDGTGLLMTEVAKQELPNANLAVLSGPTFAIEVAKGVPTAITLSCEDEEVGKKLIAAIGTPTFRPYLSNDLIGSEVGGAVKNVLAIACGIVAGKGFGDNTRAALITRGLAEIMRLAEGYGGKRETLMGLSGLGDLILTANSMQSRNFSLGFALGKGEKLDKIMSERNTVAEGVFTAPAVCEAAKKRGVEMPICFAINEVLNHNADLDTMIKSLLERPFKTEFGYYRKG